MKTLIAFLLLSLPAFAQTTIANEYQGLDVPAGSAIQVRYGCAAAWSATSTFTGPIKGLQIYPKSSTLTANWTDAGCPARVLQAFSGATAVTVTVYTYGAHPSSQQVVIPAGSTPPTGTITLKVPFTLTCTLTGTTDSTGALVETLTCPGIPGGM